MTLVGPNIDIVILFSFVSGVVVAITFMMIIFTLTGSPQPHCGVCICP